MKDNFYLLLFNLYQKFGNSPYIKLIIILFFTFLFVVLLAYVRKHIFQISMRGTVFGFFLGMVLVLVFDLIILAALADKTKIQKLFSGEKRQEALGEVVISGVNNLSKILGVSTIVSPRKPKTAQEVISDILLLPDEEAQKVKNLICPK
ncbi:hypothetical protein COU95_01280 [Candidatus Shapirobacteria bacterium CG10_big_fil_rev_8_21_14_0_10_40_9]|uniref:Uncharacterized protein n=1 Tax=Candidatus Shapirobacteria bacterium CG10_big_fil_rev_8_21_14_0_10_40_9 TaxID=1974888 RepID=A0A2M8L3Y5_9BACT|nr:MAG: hypothetical protein COU95_01280 [Candidatus Shapirobacteria bacterium CG10_big_fil_rev_8_21_14_0_10_40_9]